MVLLQILLQKVESAHWFSDGVSVEAQRERERESMCPSIPLSHLGRSDTVTQFIHHTQAAFVLV